jgi:hypothetical protein
MAQSQRRLPTAEESEKRSAPWFTYAQPAFSPSEVLSYVVQRRACTTMAALSSFQKHDVPWLFLHGMRVRRGYWRARMWRRVQRYHELSCVTTECLPAVLVPFTCAGLATARSR